MVLPQTVLTVVNFEFISFEFAFELGLLTLQAAEFLGRRSDIIDKSGKSSFEFFLFLKDRADLLFELLVFQFQRFLERSLLLKVFLDLLAISLCLLAFLLQTRRILTLLLFIRFKHTDLFLCSRDRTVYTFDTNSQVTDLLTHLLKIDLLLLHLIGGSADLFFEFGDLVFSFGDNEFGFFEILGRRKFIC